MKVRDIQKYLKGYCPNTDISLLGTDAEPFLETIYGVGQELDSTIRDVASFAKDSEEQLFYEFVQNAFDAQADSLCFYFDKDYLIVLNNGDPFYTDYWERGIRPRDGQLYNFLAKGKSLKAGDVSKSGEFGQGSKLLYTLISDKSAASNKSLLLKSIKQEKKGPYLVSWGNVDQLNCFRFQASGNWTRTDPYAEKTDLLICKILMTYYPIAPGINEGLFSMSELKSIRKAFERLVDPKRNINRLSKGTAIIVPLGMGQYEAIAEEDNLKKVMTRLAGFAALTADKERNQGRHLDHIYVNGQEVEMKHDVRSLFVNFSIPDADDRFSYQFAFNPIFARDNAVTLFRTLPITEARYNMGFIIDSQNFEHDSSRQRINDTKKTGIQLREAFRHLLDQVETIRTTDKEQFDYLYDAIIASRPVRKDDVLFIREPFLEVFAPFIRKTVKTQDGDYLPMNLVRRPDELCKGIPIETLGLEGRHWISEEFTKREIERFGLDIASLSLQDILLEADEEKLRDWIGSLSNEEYLTFHKAFLNLSKEDSRFYKKALFKSNKGNIYSLSEILSDENPVILYNETRGHAHLDRCLEIEYILGPIQYVSPDSTSNNATINVSKIARQIDFFRGDDARVDVACRVLVEAKASPRALTAIKEKIALFPGEDGVYRPLKKLIRQKPSGTILFDSYCASGYIPTVDGLDDLFISTPEEVWKWLVDNIDELTALPDWASQYGRYLKDIVSVFRSAGEPPTRLRLYLDADGVPTQDKTFRLRSADRLDSEEYDRVASFAETQGYSLIPYLFRKTLSEAPFTSEAVDIDDIIGDEASADSRLLGCLVKVAGTGLLRSFKITKADADRYAIKESSDKSFTCDFEDEAIDRALATISYSRIDPDVCRYFDPAQLADFGITTCHELMASVVSNLQATLLPVILPLVKRHNETIVQSYFNRMPGLSIDAPVEEDNPAWQVIRFALSKISQSVPGCDYRGRLLRIISHKGQRLPDSIKAGVVRFHDTDYDLYKLIEDIRRENELADSFLACIPDPNTFRRVVYANNQEEKKPKEVYDKLHDSELDVEQLRFCLDYSLVEHCSYRGLKLREDVPLAKALDMIRACGFVGFDEYFAMKGFNKGTQVYAPQDLLIDIERLPSDISAWIDKDRDGALRLIKGLHTETDSFIAIRAALKANQPFSSFSWVTEGGEPLRRTIQWIIKQAYPITLSYSDSRFTVLRELLSRLPEHLEPLPALRYTASFSPGIDGAAHQVLSFEYISSQGALMDFENAAMNSSQIEGTLALKDFFNKNQVYGYDLNYLTKQRLNRARYRIRTTAAKKEYPEWSAKVYNQWKGTDDSDGFRVFISERPVNIILSVTDESTGDHVLDITSRNDLFGYDIDGKAVVIQYPNREKLSEMKTLERMAKVADFFKNPFIALQGIYVEMVEKGIDPNALTENEKKAVEMAQVLGEGAVDKINENLDTVKNIVEGLTEEELKTVAENKDRIRNLLEDLPDDDDESMRSKVRKTIGYIGELIYEQYLKNNHIEHRYAAAEGVGDYDFELKATSSHPAIYVDVKTNLYSFKEEAVPFYIHKSQNRFMQMHPEEPFRIVRISLTDLDLNKSYERIRDLYGAEADYETNPALRKACQDIAKKYWRAARIEEFDAASPEYGIKIERLPRV